MTGFILATKVKQTSGFDEQKKRQVYTILKIDSCYVSQIKTLEKDGYQAIQIGFAHKSLRNINKVTKGQSTKAGLESPLSFLAEIRLDDLEASSLVTEKGKQGYKINDKVYFPGTAIDPTELFSVKDQVQVTGTTKSKGFAGVVKRHHFAGGPKTHGQSDRLRAPGAIGSGTTPGRIWKGKRMAGRLGGVRHTIKGLKVAKVEKGELVLQGLVPGPARSILTIVKMNS